MLKEHLIVETRPQAKAENVLLWGDYRVSVLAPRLFRLERSERGIFRDDATQSVWYRDAEKQNFTFREEGDKAIVDTGECKLILTKERGQVCVELDGVLKKADNAGNLLGTYRTLDGCDGELYTLSEPPKKIELCNGVCSKTGVAVLDDSASLTLGKDGQVKNVRADGSDEYIFAFGDDYRGAVRALYALTGGTPLVPRFALGNWWSRYHVYTDKEYLRVLTAFTEREIPVTVATVDMDWHYSEQVDEEKQITAQGKTGKEYVGECAVNLGWTGYSWNTKLFPDYRGFLQKVKDMGMKITLNLHPSDGVRFWEDGYEEMANAVGVEPSTQRQIPFNFTFDGFINPYFTVLHHPYERAGVDFWWIDWQQPNIPWHGAEEEKYDPLWALNHYHYADNARGSQTPLVLSRYAGVGSHRYPLGFSGDTAITWKTLAYLPYFTATASNIGYTWWSHDIGGHHSGKKEDELYVRHLQYGVFSPINRLHCTSAETMTKEPWAYKNGSGLLAAELLRFRHKLIPYLYTASHATHAEGKALVEPLYYEWKTPLAYRYKREYLFAEQLLVVPVITKRLADGYARTKGWLPEGKWTDIFTGEEYEAGKGGKELTFLRTLDGIPVLAKQGCILPLSLDKGNACDNPESLEIWAYEGEGEYVLYEDGKERAKRGEFFTCFQANASETEGVCTQTLTISSEGESGVIPQNRTLFVRFKNIPLGEVSLYVDGEKVEREEWLTDCAAIRFPFEGGRNYRVEVRYEKRSELQKWQAFAKWVLLSAEEENEVKREVYRDILRAQTLKEGLAAVEKSPLREITKLRLCK